MSRILGIDCGRVIFYPLGKQVPGSVESLRKLIDSNTFDAIHIVSRASVFNRLYFPFRLWLLGFWQRTGIPRENLHFCFRNHEKAGLCRTLGVTHFIDDRIDVLRHLDTVPHRYALDPEKEELEKYPDAARGATIVRSWAELMPLLLDRS